MVQIADGAMAEVHEMLHRGTEISIKATNGTLTDDDRSYIQQEIGQLKKEICTCSNNYSIRCTDGTTNSGETSGEHYICNIRY